MSYIVKCKFCEPNIEGFHLLRLYLPEDYEYMVCSFSTNGPNFKTRLRTNGKAQEYAQKWLEDFQMHSKCTMRVERTYPHSGAKNVFKVDLRCQHNTRPRSEKVREKDSCKNTDCPAKMGITIKRVVTERKSRSKDPHLPTFPTVLQLDFCHNHPISTPEILRHRSVLPDVKSKILSLFQLGHNPSTALDMHKYDLQLEHGENYQKISIDRALVPDPQFCYRLYYKIIRKQSGLTTDASDVCSVTLQTSDSEPEVKVQTTLSSDIERCLAQNGGSENGLAVDPSGRKAKKKRKLESTLLDKSRIAAQLEDMLCKFCESGGFAGMQLIDEHTVMALCTPLMHRVHTLVKQSGELVFVDAYGELDEANACRVLLFVTQSCAGALPLGCVVTTSASADCIKAALDLWKQILPEGCFYGKGAGPQMFLTNDCEAEKHSLKACFPQSHLFVCISHILQASWSFIWDRKHSIKKEHRSLLFSKVKMLLFSQTVDELEMNYAYAIQDSFVKLYSVFLDHLNNIYNHRHDWSLVYHRHLLPRSNDVSLFWEVATVLLKDPILSRSRTFNQLQIVDFLSRLDTYYERCLIDIANNRIDSVKNSRFLFIELPQEAYTITQKSESEYEVHNDTKDTSYHLDITLGMCECRTGKNGAPCKHQLLVLRNFLIPVYDYISVNTPAERCLLFQLATGQEVESSTSLDTANGVHNVVNDACNSDVRMHNLSSCGENSFFMNDTGACDNLDQNVLNNPAPITQGSQHNSIIPVQNSPLLPLNPALVQPTILGHQPPNFDHHHGNSLDHSSPQIPPMPHDTSALSQPPTTQENGAIHHEVNHMQQTQAQTVHDLIDEACKRLKERSLRMPQTFIPALDTFLKNLDRLSSDSSLEYALYSFGKFSKSAVPLFKRKVVNNKLVGLQSAGDLKKKQHSRTRKVVGNHFSH